MNKRLFIAINLPKELKGIIRNAVGDLWDRYDIEMKWILPEYWHLTVSFLGWQSDQAIDGIIRAMKDVVEEFPSPTIELGKIILAPDPENPRMIWLSGTEESSRNLGELKGKIEDSLVDNNVRFKIEKRKFNMHINLARMRSEEMSNVDMRGLQEMVDQANLKLEKYLPMSFEAQSLDLMESHLERSGAEYLILSEFKFKQYL